MALAVFGLPGGFLEWSLAVIRASATIHNLDIRVMDLDRTGSDPNTLDTSENEFAAGTPQAVLTAYTLKPTTIELCLDRNIPVVLCLEDPSGAVEALVGQEQLSFDNALLIVATSAARLAPYVANPKVTVLWEPISGGPDAFSRLTSIIGISPNESFANQVRQAPEVVKADRRRRNAAMHENREWQTLSDIESGIIEDALGAYATLFGGDILGTISWRRELFMIGDEQGARATRPVDIAGRPRCLFFGPYLPLPPGSWRAKVGLGIGPEATSQPLLVEVCTHTSLAHVVIAPPQSGLCEVELDFSLTNSDALVELRLFNMRPSFEGLVSWGGAMLTPLTASEAV